MWLIFYSILFDSFIHEMIHSQIYNNIISSYVHDGAEGVNTSTSKCVLFEWNDVKWTAKLSKGLTIFARALEHISQYLKYALERVWSNYIASNRNIHAKITIWKSNLLKRRSFDGFIVLYPSCTTNKEICLQILIVSSIIISSSEKK